MTYEVPQPERDRTPASNVFNLDVMSDSQIVAVGRALYRAEDETRAEEPVKPPEQQDSSFEDLYNALWTGLTHDLGKAARDNPDRYKGLLTALSESSEEPDRDLVVETLPVVAEADYLFASELLLRMDRDNQAVGRIDDIDYCWHIADSFSEHVAPELAADIVARMDAQQEPFWR